MLRGCSAAGSAHAPTLSASPSLCYGSSNKSERIAAARKSTVPVLGVSTDRPVTRESGLRVDRTVALMRNRSGVFRVRRATAKLQRGDAEPPSKCLDEGARVGEAEQE